LAALDIESDKRGLTMTRGVPVLDPKIHLKGATPEKLARALFRRTEPLRPPRKKAADAKTPAAKPASNKAGDGAR